MSSEPAPKQPKTIKPAPTPATTSLDTEVISPIEMSTPLSPTQIIRLQRVIGNQGVQRLLGIQRDAAPANPTNLTPTEEQKREWDLEIENDIGRILILLPYLQTLTGIPTSDSFSDQDKVVKIFEKWRELDEKHGMNNRLLLRFVNRVSSKTLTVSGFLGVEQMTNLLDELKRHLGIQRFFLSQILKPIGKDEEPEELVSFTDTLGETILEFLVTSPFFLLGVLEGALASVSDLIESVGDIAKGLLTLLEDPLKIIDYAKELYEAVSSLDLAAMGDEIADGFMAGWTNDDTRKRAQFQGHVIGYVLMEILFFYFTAGEATAAKVATKASKFSKLTQMLRGSKQAQAIIQKVAPTAKAIGKGANITGEVVGSGTGALGSAMEHQTEEGAETENEIEAEEEIDEEFVYEGQYTTVEVDLENIGTNSETGMIQRAPMPGVKRGRPGEKQILNMLKNNEIDGMPRFKHVLEAQHNGVNGIDLIGVEVVNGKVRFHVIEVKGGLTSTLKDTKFHGFQLSREWVQKNITKALNNREIYQEIKAVTKITDKARLIREITNAPATLVASANHLRLDKLRSGIKRISKAKRPVNHVLIPPQRRKRFFKGKLLKR